MTQREYHGGDGYVNGPACGDGYRDNQSATREDPGDAGRGRHARLGRKGEIVTAEEIDGPWDLFVAGGISFRFVINASTMARQRSEGSPSGQRPAQGQLRAAHRRRNGAG